MGWRVEGLRARFGEIGDARLPVMAAIMVSDELVEAGKRMRRLERSLAGCTTPARRASSARS